MNPEYMSEIITHREKSNVDTYSWRCMFFYHLAVLLIQDRIGPGQDERQGCPRYIALFKSRSMLWHALLNKMP
jgi:hypothetical protein